jgi:ATP synthase protein I
MRDTLPDDGKKNADGDPAPRGDAELEARRGALAEALGKRRGKASGGPEDRGSDSKAGWGLAVKVSSEFIAGVAVGAILGYGFDRWFETSPWGLIVFLMLGFAAGVLNVLRAVGKVADRPGL